MNKTLELKAIAVRLKNEKLKDGSFRQIGSVNLDLPGEEERLRAEVHEEEFPEETYLQLRIEAHEAMPVVGQRYRVTITPID